jgi:hypothetical protein
VEGDAEVAQQVEPFMLGTEHHHPLDAATKFASSMALGEHQIVAMQFECMINRADS